MSSLKCTLEVSSTYFLEALKPMKPIAAMATPTVFPSRKLWTLPSWEAGDFLQDPAENHSACFNYFFSKDNPCHPFLELEAARKTGDSFKFLGCSNSALVIVMWVSHLPCQAVKCRQVWATQPTEAPTCAQLPFQQDGRHKHSILNSADMDLISGPGKENMFTYAFSSAF